MLTSITTTTITTIAAGGQNTVLRGIVVGVVLLLLVQRQLATAGDHRVQAVSRALSMAIAPMLIIVAVILIRQVAAAL
jgi:hypothetical protein